MAPLSQPPEIRRRDIDFGMRSAIPVHWLDGQCHRTRFYDAMSIMFPEGERGFIESVHFYRERIPAGTRLAQEVKAFIGQEALHTREHQRYNARLAGQGAPVDALERQVAAQQDFARRHLPPSVRLAFTVCLEHFTAMFADQLLRHPRMLLGADARMERLWRWHALEEIEHKAVAFDVFATAVRNPVRRYLLRCVSMLCVTPVFSMMVWRFTFTLVKHDGCLFDWRGWRRLLRDQFVSPGPLLRMIPQWLAWFTPGFHPEWRDNRSLAAEAGGRYDAQVEQDASARASSGEIALTGHNTDPH